MPFPCLFMRNVGLRFANPTYQNPLVLQRTQAGFASLQRKPESSRFPGIPDSGSSPE